MRKFTQSATFYLILACVEVFLAINNIERDRNAWAFTNIVFYLMFMYFRQLAIKKGKK